jgi:hypothetical protein
VYGEKIRETCRAAEIRQSITENGKEAAAVRWAVRLSASEKLVIQLHGLPAAAAVLNGKPSYKR